MAKFFPPKIWRFSTEQFFSAADTSSLVQHKSFKASYLNGIFLLQTAMTRGDFPSKYREKT